MRLRSRSGNFISEVILQVLSLWEFQKSFSWKFRKCARERNRIDFGTWAVLYCSATSESMKNRRALSFLVGSFDTRYPLIVLSHVQYCARLPQRTWDFLFTSPSIFFATREKLACISELSLASSRVEWFGAVPSETDVERSFLRREEKQSRWRGI